MYKAKFCRALSLFLFFFIFPFSIFAEESISITTYYPAPYGSYDQLTIASNAYLATGSGTNVGIGTTSTTQKLTVSGNAQFSGNVTTPGSLTTYDNLDVSGMLSVSGTISPVTGVPRSTWQEKDCPNWTGQDASHAICNIGDWINTAHKAVILAVRRIDSEKSAAGLGFYTGNNCTGTRIGSIWLATPHCYWGYESAQGIVLLPTTVKSIGIEWIGTCYTGGYEQYDNVVIMGYLD